MIDAIESMIHQMLGEVSSKEQSENPILRKKSKALLNRFDKVKEEQAEREKGGKNEQASRRQEE